MNASLRTSAFTYTYLDTVGVQYSKCDRSSCILWLGGSGGYGGRCCEWAAERAPWGGV